jgi:predicted nucleic acid-binding protein
VIVLDSSAAVDYLVRLRDQGDWVADQLLAGDDLHAPHVLDVEVVGALRTLVSHRELDPARGARALEALNDLDIARYPHLPFTRRMWSLRENHSAADAAFIALAQALDATLLTTDGRLARAPNLPVPVLAPPGAPS